MGKRADKNDVSADESTKQYNKAQLFQIKKIQKQFPKFVVYLK